jgi:PAS domain S-box-containing protein
MSNHKITVGKKSRTSKKEVLTDDSYFAENLYEIAQVIVLILDAKGKIVRFNPYMEELSGYRLTEVKDKDWFTTFLPERDRERTRKLFLKAVGDIQTRGNVNAIVTNDGRERMISWYDKTIKNQNGKVTGLLSIGIDITERLAAEQESRQVHKELQESVERYRSLIESSEDPIYLVDRNLKYLLANEKLLLRLGKSLDEVVGQDYSQFHPPENTQEFLLKVEQVYETGKPISYEHKSQRDGHEFIRTLSPVISPKTGEVTAVTVISKDITERKRAEKALRESEKRYRTLFENMAQGIFYQRADGVVIDCNPAVLEMFGLTRDQFLGRTSMDPRWKVIHEDGSDFPGEHHPSMEALRIGKSVHGVVAGVFNPRKEDCVWLSINAIPQFRPGEDKPYQVFVTLHDISERKQAEEELKESEERFRTIIENAPFGYYRIGKDELWQYVNPVWERMHGFSWEEVVGKSFEITQTEDDVEKAREIVQRALAGETIVGEFSRRTSRGNIKYHSFNVQPVKQNNEIVALEGFINDITERKRAEEDLRESEEKYRLLFNEVPTGIVISTIKGNIIELNKAQAEIIGYTVEELKGKSVNDYYVYPDKRIEMIELFKKKGKVHDFEMELKKKDGSIVIELISLEQIKISGKTYLFACGKDITERKRAHEEIEKIAKFPEENPEPVIRLNRDGTVLYANKASEPLLTDWGWCRGKKIPRDWQIVLTETLETNTTSIIEMQCSGKIYSFFFAPIMEAGYVNLYGRDITELKSSEKALFKSEYMLRKLRERTEKIVDEEQRRICQIIHDDLGQTLTGLMLDMESIRQGNVPLPAHSKKIDEIIHSIQFLVERTRTISTELRPPILDDLGLSAAIRWKIRELKTHINIPCQFNSVPQNIALDSGSNMAFFSIFKEALTNIVRHAAASEINISLIQTAHSTTLRIEDNGKGINVQAIESKDSIGIYGMRIQAQSIGARFTISGKPGKGTTITVELQHDRKQVKE